jgi:hypothetical protein
MMASADCGMDDVRRPLATISNRDPGSDDQAAHMRRRRDADSDGAVRVPSQLAVALKDIPAGIPDPETVGREGGPATEEVAPGHAPGPVAEPGRSRPARGKVAHLDGADRRGRQAEEEKHEKRFLHQSISLVPRQGIVK